MWFLLIPILVFLGNPSAYSQTDDQTTILQKVNNLRAKGCKCGYNHMPPVGPLSWNSTLEESALSHAKEMARYGFFAHYSKDGKNIGQRIMDHGYKWQVVGENIAEGQLSFDQALTDWIKSESHCKMLMDGRVTEMGVSRHQKFWVHHFAKPKRKYRHRRG